jgi:hypothetical protein
MRSSSGSEKDGE